MNTITLNTTMSSLPLSILDAVGELTLNVARGCVRLADRGALCTGDVSLQLADMTGGTVLSAIHAPTYLNTPVVRRTIGTVVLSGSMVTCADLLLSKHSTRDKVFVPLSIPTLEVSPVASQPVRPTMEQQDVLTGPSESLQRALQTELLEGTQLTPAELIHLGEVVHYQGSTPLKEAILSMPTSSQRKFYGLFVEYHSLTGERVNLKSAWRSMQKQQSLRKSYGAQIAAEACGSAHAMAAVDIDRRGMTSVQAKKMPKLGLFNKHGLWIPPYVGEPWHVEDPDTVYFRFWSKKDVSRTIYRGKVCAGLNGRDHTRVRLQEGTFTIRDSFSRISALADSMLENYSSADRALLKEYLLTSVRAESMYGRNMMSKTGALGWWQFMPKVAEEYSLKYPMQLKEAARATLELAINNRRGLEKDGVSVTAKSLYLSHMVGRRGFSIIVKAAGGAALTPDDRSVLDRVVSVNIGSTDRATLYTGTVPDLERIDTVSDAEVGTAFLAFWRERWVQYEADTQYLLTS